MTRHFDILSNFALAFYCLCAYFLGGKKSGYSHGSLGVKNASLTLVVLEKRGKLH